MSAEHWVPWTMLISIVISGCGDDPIPKPKGYFRIDLPPKEMRSDSACDLRFTVSDHFIVMQREESDTACWFNLRMRSTRATIHCTYRKVQNDLPALVTDAHQFKNKHESKAVRIDSERILRADAKVYGVLFSVDGDVASPMQFYLTDSTDHFLYGSLYFRARPNGDSLAPVSAYLRDDIRRLAQTLVWP